MLPALKLWEGAQLVCVGSRTMEKACAVAAQFDCEAIDGYEGVLRRSDVDLVYVPLPTGLHYEWCKLALQAGKHLLVEKSLANDVSEVDELLELAKRENLLLMENFQFQTHSQWGWIKECMRSGRLGDVHLLRSTFGFPPLPADNFRWNKALGGGALLDTGAYMAKVCCLVMGSAVDVVGSVLWMDKPDGIDRYGEAVLCAPDKGMTAQVAFGFDYFYQCRLEILGTCGKLQAERVYTAPPGYSPLVIVEQPGERHEYMLPPDNHYLNMWRWCTEVWRSGNYEPHWTEIRQQAQLLDRIRAMAQTRLFVAGGAGLNL